VEDKGLAPREPWVESMLPMTEGQLGVRAARRAKVLGVVYGNPGISLVNVLIPTDEPALLRSDFGKRKCYYFAGPIGRHYRRYGQANLLSVLRRLLDRAVGKAAPVALDAPTSVELFAHTQKGEEHLVVNLVNIFTGLARSDGRALTQGIRHDEYEESPRLSEVVLRFRKRRGKAVRKAYLAPSKKKLSLATEGAETLVTIKSLAEHAMVVAEY